VKSVQPCVRIIFLIAHGLNTKNISAVSNKRNLGVIPFLLAFFFQPSAHSIFSSFLLAGGKCWPNIMSGRLRFFHVIVPE